MGLDLSATVPDAAELVQSLYVAYYGRAADPAGRTFWADRYDAQTAEGLPPDTALAQIASAFAATAESRDTYPFLADPAAGDAAAFVRSVFEQAFGRQPDGSPDDPTTGFGFWTQRITEQVQNDVPIGNSILAILEGAQGADRASILNKMAAADGYTDAVSASDTAYATDPARDLLDGISSDLTQIDARAAGVAAAPAGPVTTQVELADDPALTGLGGAITDAVTAGLAAWTARMDPAQAVVDVRVEAIDTGALAQAGSPFFSEQADTPGGVPTVLAHELTTGNDLNGSAVDVTIQLSRQNIGEIDFGTGDGRFDALRVFTHEIGHALGVASLEDDASAPFVTVWDTFTERRDGQLVFTGPAAVAANAGEAVPLDDTAHLDEATFPDALMRPRVEAGESNAITPIDIALVADLGLPVDDGSGFGV